MNVVYASNENYVRHMAASMVSLFEQNQKRRKLTVYVFSIGIRKESRMLLENMAGGYGRRIRWVELGDIREQFDFGIDTGGFDVSTMARLFVGSRHRCSVCCIWTVIRWWFVLWEGFGIRILERILSGR